MTWKDRVEIFYMIAATISAVGTALAPDLPPSSTGATPLSNGLSGPRLFTRSFTKQQR